MNLLPLRLTPLRPTTLRALLALPLLGLAAASAPAASSSSPLPADVQRFIAQRDLCDHFRGEEPYDAARARELRSALARYCTGTDQALKGLRAKYASAPSVLRALRDYEDQVE